MNKLLLLAVSCFVILSLLPSCQKEIQQSERIREITIDTTVQSGGDYELHLSVFGDDDDFATIIQQGNNYSVSQLEDLSDIFAPVYHYVPKAKATGTDQVVLAISKFPGSKRCNRDSTIITINFTIK